MIVAMQETASEEQIQQVVEHLIRMGFSVHRTTGERQTVLAAVGARVDFDTRNLEVLSGVEHVHRISAPYKLAGRSFRPQGTLISFPNGVTIGGDQVVVMAGPCSVESREQLLRLPRRYRKRVHGRCAAAHSSHVPRHTRSRGWASKRSNCFAKPETALACW